MTQISTNKTDQQSNEPAISSEEDYNLIEGALLQNPRGRWFLEEYIKRNRPEDTQKLLEAIHRIENNLQQKAEPSQEEIDPIRMSIIEMSKAIAKTREEINSIKPTDENQNQLINANEELSAIVESTEKATNTILEAAEEIQEAAWLLREAGADSVSCDKIDANTTDIYTACSFQDITGQRTNKVVQALCYIENRVNAMIDIWGLSDLKDNTPIQENKDTRPDSHLLNGPSLEGQGLGQGNVDDVFHSEASEGSDDFQSIDTGQDLADSMSFDSIGSDFDTVEDMANDVNMAAQQDMSSEMIDDISFDAIGSDTEITETATSDDFQTNNSHMADLDMAEVDIDNIDLTTTDLDNPDFASPNMLTEPAPQLANDQANEDQVNEDPFNIGDFSTTSINEDTFSAENLGSETDMASNEALQQEVSFDTPDDFAADDFNLGNFATDTIAENKMHLSTEIIHPDIPDLSEATEELAIETSIQPLSPVTEHMMDFGDIAVTDSEFNTEFNIAELDPAQDLTSEQMIGQPVEQAPENQMMEDMTATTPQFEDQNITTPQAMENIEELEIDELSELQQEILLS